MDDQAVEEFKKIIDLHSREFLIALREVALENAEVRGVTPTWARRFNDIGDAADVLDAFHRRTQSNGVGK